MKPLFKKEKAIQKFLLFMLFMSLITFMATNVFSQTLNDGNFSNLQQLTGAFTTGTQSQSVFYSQIGVNHASISTSGNTGNCISMGGYGNQVVVSVAAPASAQTLTIAFDQRITGGIYGGPNFSVMGLTAGQSLSYSYGGGSAGTSLLSLSSGTETVWTRKSYSVSVPAGLHSVVLRWFVDGAGMLIDNVSISGSDTQAPTVPTGLASASVTQTSFTLNWTASTDNVGVTGYEVFRNGTSIGTPTTNTFSVTGLTCATAYSMTVRARDAAGNWSAQSTVRSVTTSACPDTQAPTVPTGLASASVTQTSFTLNWTVATDNVGVTGYEVFRNGTSIGTPTTNSFSVTGLTCGTAYSMTVRARDAAGNWSAQSTIRNVTTSACPDITAPSVPTGLASTSVTQTSFTLNWTASTDNVGVTGYEVFRNGTSIGTPTTNTFSVTGLTCGTTYLMTVRARDAAGNWSAVTAARSVTTSACSSTKLTGTIIGTNGAWNNGTDTKENAMDGSTTTFFDGPTANAIWVGLDLGSAKQITQVRFYPRNTFEYRMTNGKFQGSSTADFSSGVVDLYNITAQPPLAWSQPAITNTTSFRYVRYLAPENGYGNVAEVEFYGTGGSSDTQAPSVPSNLSASIITTTSFTLTWTASTDNVAVTGYEVFCNGISIGTPSTNTFSVTGLTCGTSYSMTVRARDAAGNWSAQSSASSFSTSACPSDNISPSVPTNLQASGITSSSFSLTWNASTDNVGVTGYEVFRNGTSIGTPSTNSFSVTGLTCGTSYSMTVRARDAAGNWSNQSTAQSFSTSACIPVTTKNLMGINLSFSFVDYCEDRLFADAMMHSRGWTAPNSWDPVSMDANGWPTDDAQIYVWAGIANMNGTYKLSFTGQAASIVNGDGQLTVANKVYNASTNTTTADLIFNGTTIYDNLRLRLLGTVGGVKNVKLMRPLTPGSSTSYSMGTLFSNEIKTLASKFSCVRFMDYFNTNLNKMVSWSQRPKPTDASQQFRTVGGVLTGGCLEYAIMFCNETNTDMWLNLNVNLNDDFITKAAQIIRYGSDGVNPYTSTQANPVYPPLNSTLKVYVEYGNEVWNSAGGFTQMGDNYAMAVAEVNAGNSPLNYDGNPSDWFWAFRRVGKRTVDISNIFRAVHGDANMMTRIRPVLCGQLPGGAIEQLTFIEQIYTRVTTWCSNPHPVNYYLYGTGGSAYYGPNADNLTIDNIWSAPYMTATGWKPQCEPEAVIAHAFGLKRVAYEGGPSMDVRNTPDDAVQEAAWADPRMGDVIVNMHNDAWSASGGELLVYYYSSSHYAWAFAKDMFNLNTPKLNGIDRLNAANKAPVTYFNVPPLTFAGINNSYFPGYNGAAFSFDNTFVIRESGYLAYTFRVNTAGTYNVSVNLSGTVTLILDGIERGVETGSNTNTPTYTMANLQPGLHSVLLKSNAGWNYINSVTVNLGAGTKSIGVEEKIFQNSVISVYPNPIPSVNLQKNL